MRMLLLIATFLTACSSAEDTKFSSWFCKSPSDCTLHHRDVRFSASPEKNLVVIKFYDQGNIRSTIFLKECTIMDIQNWECTHINTAPNYSYKIKRTGDLIETSDANIKFEKSK